MISFTRTDRGVSFILKGRPRTIANDHVNFETILDAIREGNSAVLESLCDIPSFIARLTKGDVQISDDEVRFRDQKVPEYLAARILSYEKQKLPIEPICKFAEKLMGNPTLDVRGDLYKWLEKGNMPICEDGDFLGYKVVTKDYFSIHRGPHGPVYQGLGEVVELDRAKCDANRDVTCSTGLHFCSYDYLPSFGGLNQDQNRIIIVKINPADVVAIPTDYNLTKGRTCRFEVVDTVPVDELESRFGGGRIVNDYSVKSEEDNSTDDSWDGLDAWEGNSDSWEEEINTEAANDAQASTAKYFERDGVKYYHQDIIQTVDELGPVAASKELDIPRSTLYNWYKRATA